jgi:hypothetical protein
MITLFCIILALAIFFKLYGFAMRLGWGIFRSVLFLICLPAVILALVFGGIFIAIPVLLIAGFVCFIVKVAC